MTRYSRLLSALLLTLASTLAACSSPPRTTVPPKKVLVVLPMTGAAASWGEHFKRGVDMFLQTAEAPKIQVEVIDSQTNPAQAQSAVRQAALAGKPYAVVSTLSSITVPLRAWAQGENVFLVACMISDRVLEGGGLVQRLYPSVEDNARPLAQYALARFSKVGILFSNEELGVSVRRRFERDYLTAGKEVILAEGYELRNTDVRSTVDKMIKASPEAVVVTGIGPAFWAIIREFKTQQYKGQLLSDASFADPVQIDLLGAAAEGVVFTGSETELTAPRTPVAQTFNQQFAARFGVPINYTGVTVYEALQTLNRLAATNDVLDSAAYSSLKEWQGVPGAIRFLPGGDSQYPWFLVKREGGRTVPLVDLH